MRRKNDDVPEEMNSFDSSSPRQRSVTDNTTITNEIDKLRYPIVDLTILQCHELTLCFDYTDNSKENGVEPGSVSIRNADERQAAPLNKLTKPHKCHRRIA